MPSRPALVAHPPTFGLELRGLAWPGATCDVGAVMLGCSTNSGILLQTGRLAQLVRAYGSHP